MKKLDEDIKLREELSKTLYFYATHLRKNVFVHPGFLPAKVSQPQFVSFLLPFMFTYVNIFSSLKRNQIDFQSSV